MTPQHRSRVACLVGCALVGFALPARAQFELVQPSTEAVSTAIKSNPDLVNGLAKELQATPEPAAAAAGALFGIAKSLMAPEDFAQVSKAVPDMESLLAAAPKDTDSTLLTPGFAASSSPATMTMAAPNGMASAIGTLSKLGIKPDMIAKAVPFLSGYMKKHGTAAIGGLLGSVFKTGK